MMQRAAIKNSRAQRVDDKMAADTGLVCLQDYEQHALSRLDKNALDYYRCGAGEEDSLQLNRTCFKRLRIRPRCLRDVSLLDLSTSVLGATVALPVGIAPTAMQSMAHSDGELASARAAEEAGAIFVLSTLSTSSIEEVASAAPNAVKWFQLYIYRDRELTRELVRRAEWAGYKALVLTVDAPVFGNRRCIARDHFQLPSHLRLANFTGINESEIHDSKGGSGINEYAISLFDTKLTWDDVIWLKSITQLPIVLKGVLTAEDAVKGADAGAAAILVSNHGGRQVDGAPAAIEALPEVARAVGDRVEVYMDGGVTQGTDVFKALALGARMVFIGRPALWGLAHSGKRGVCNVLSILRRELEITFQLTGCASVVDVSSKMVVHESSYYKL
ncbi:L-lactate oxidase-like isoform X1 [Bacillus rossius redtenbacheri]|uniref:L-lactate oxidase-like isoform X1 n=1 Tax=Bacillus rossius redtenbacheri TaxID=93214 RepID=UPI002FDEE9BC